MRPTRSSPSVTRFVLCFLIAAFGLTSPLAAAPPNTPAPVPPRGPERAANLATVQSLLEARFGVHPLPAKAIQKLHRMTDQQIAQIASLCARIARESGAPEGNVALLLVTALIILS
jgi:hypothetical protein